LLIQKKVLVFVSLAVLTLFATPALRAADRMKSGKWEYTMTTDGETKSLRNCVTPEEAAGVNGDSRTARAWAEKKAGGRCAIEEFKIDGDVVSYTIVCGDRTIRSTSTYSGESFEGILTTTYGGHDTSTRVKAKRLGACP
jgi:hypothetical protein